ncbi:MAG: MMPL family transporter [Pseudomonadales bacterium]|nr:MMPL family transporter [Pseudomonadales bacterium]
MHRSSSHIWAIGWLLLVIAIVFLAVKKQPSFDSDIMTLLPISDQQPIVQKVTQKMAEGFSSKLIMMLSGESDKEVRNAVRSLATALSNPDAPVAQDIANVLWQSDGTELASLKAELFPYRFAILDEQIRSSLLAGDYEAVMNRALFRLYSPMPTGEISIVEDPFGLFSTLSMNRQVGLNVQISDSLIKVTTTDRPTYILIVSLAGKSYSPAVQERVLGLIAEQKKILDASGVTLDMSGMLLHAAAGARQATSEISTIGVGSLLGIVVIMLLVFRRVTPMLLMLLSVSAGCVTAAAVTMLVFDRVHLVTFAFGAGLVGVSIDYSLHFICERHATSSNQILRRLLPGLLLALFSSTIAYAAQALSPFPGLQQMALFSVAGLVSSWLTVILWFPLLTTQYSQSRLVSAEKLKRLRDSFPLLNRNVPIMSLLAGAFVLSIFLLWNSVSLDDVRLLQTSPTSLLKEEERVRNALGINSSVQYMLVSGTSVEQSLQKEQRLIAGLDQLKSDGLLEDYQALTTVLPSLNRQQQNIGLIESLYQHQLATFYNVLKMPAGTLEKAQLALIQQTDLLSPEIWQQQRSSESWKNLLVMIDETEAATVIRFSGKINDELRQKLIALSGTEPDVLYVDQVQMISDLMETYRYRIIQWVLLAYLVVFLVLLIRYKRQVWRVMAPPVLASVFTLAMLVQIEGGLNLFHFLALILVLGIGLDMGIFLSETNESAYTWLAVSLSTVTSLLAFGLLALSDTPVLHHFGLTVLIGLIFVWLLAPLMRNTNLA